MKNILIGALVIASAFSHLNAAHAAEFKRVKNFAIKEVVEVVWSLNGDYLLCAHNANQSRAGCGMIHGKKAIYDLTGRELETEEAGSTFDSHFLGYDREQDSDDCDTSTRVNDEQLEELIAQLDQSKTYDCKSIVWSFDKRYFSIDSDDCSKMFVFSREGLLLETFNCSPGALDWSPTANHFVVLDRYGTTLHLYQMCE